MNAPDVLEPVPVQNPLNVKAVEDASRQNVIIRPLDWGQAPAPKDCDRSLTVVICPAERGPELEAAMASHYPMTQTVRVTMGNDRVHRQFRHSEWMAMARKCSRVLLSVHGQEESPLTADSSHLVVYAPDVDFVPRELLVCADLLFWYNGDGNTDTHVWAGTQINKYMSLCTSQLMNSDAPREWRRTLIANNGWLDRCQHWIGMDLRASQRTWITLPLMDARV